MLIPLAIELGLYTAWRIQASNTRVDLQLSKPTALLTGLPSYRRLPQTNLFSY